jgi:hypothetical protein
MTERQLSTCQSCGASILWVRTLSKRRMPLDADPKPTGNVVIVKHVNGGEVGVYLSGSNLEFYSDIKERYVSHFSTCPDAKTWRRRD